MAELVDILAERQMAERARREALPVDARTVLGWVQRLHRALGGSPLAICANVQEIAYDMERRAAVMADARDLAEELWQSVEPGKAADLAAQVRGGLWSWGDAVSLLVSEAQDGDRAPAEVVHELERLAKGALRGQLQAMRRGGDRR